LKQLIKHYAKPLTNGLVINALSDITRSRADLIAENALLRAPKANACFERFIGSLKRECLDHMLILHRNQLHRLVIEFIDYYNHSRPHQGIGQRIPPR
jgi:transposase InsO family protein